MSPGNGKEAKEEAMEKSGKGGEHSKGNGRRPRLTDAFAQRMMIHKHTQTLSNSTQPTGVRVISEQ